MTILMDIDLYGRENTDGTAMEHLGDEAIKMALIVWLTSKKGEFVLNPEEGGILDVSLFKNLSTNKIPELTFKIKNAINNRFYPSIILEFISIEPNYEYRLWVINIAFRTSEAGSLQEVQIYTKDLSKRLNVVYENIEYIEENLRNFCLVQKTNMSGYKLVFNPENGNWEWGKYIFVNFSVSDPYYSEILQICNLS